MAFIISFIVVSINFGYGGLFFKIWLTIWAEAFIVAFPAAYYLPKGIKKFMKTIQFVEKQ